jgi:hypothetical protein
LRATATADSTCSGEAAGNSTIVSVVYGFSTAIGAPVPATASPPISNAVV